MTLELWVCNECGHRLSQATLIEYDGTCRHCGGSSFRPV